MTVKRTNRGVNFGLTKLIKVTKEFENVSAAAAGEGKWRPVVFKVLAESVPVSTLLILVSA